MKAMSSYWQNYPYPFYADWQSEPVPGWGVRPVMAGPAMVGVGALGASPLTEDQKKTAARNMVIALQARYKDQIAACSADGGAWNLRDRACHPPGGSVASASAGTPTWVWIAAAVVVGGGLAVASNRGLIGDR